MARLRDLVCDFLAHPEAVYHARAGYDMDYHCFCGNYKATRRLLRLRWQVDDGWRRLAGYVRG